MSETGNHDGGIYPLLRDRVLRVEYVYILMLFPVIYVIIDSYIYHLMIVVLTTVLAVHVVRTRELRLPHASVAAVSLYVLFLCYAAVSMLWSPSSEYATFKLLRLASVGLLLVVAPAILFGSRDRFHRLFGFSVYASSFVAILLIAGYLLPQYPRAFQLIGAKSHLAPGRNIGFGALVATFYLLSSGRDPRRYTYAFLVGVMVVGLTVSESRGPLIAAMLTMGVLVVLTLYVERGEKLRAFAFVLASGLGLAFLVVLHSVGVSIPTFDRIIPLLQGEVDTSNANRLEFLYNGYLLWLQSPVFGNGFGSYGVWFFGVDVRGFPHNIVLEILAELGVVGLAIFGALLAVTVRPLVANHRDHPMAILLFCLLLYGLINASFSEDLQGDRIVYAAIGLSTCIGLFGDTGTASGPDRETSSAPLAASESATEVEATEPG